MDSSFYAKDQTMGDLDVMFIDTWKKAEPSLGRFTLLLVLLSVIWAKQKKKLFHHNITYTHSSQIIAAKLYDLLLKMLPHAPYSPDLASKT